MSTPPYVIGIAGGSGSGKTFLLHCFLNHFQPEEVCLVSQDDYYIPAGEMTPEENKLYNFDLPSTIDDDHFLRDIRDLMSGKTIFKKEYAFNNPLAVPKVKEVRPAPILIIEGLFILHFKAISELIDLRIFVDTEEEIALQRRLKRDLIERGYSEGDVLYKWTNHVVPAYREYLLPYKSLCQRIVTNNTHVAADILTVTEEISRELRETALPKKIS